MSRTTPYQALATDYDGTLATDGIVFPSTIAALEELVATGTRLVLVTGRQLADLEAVFPRLDLFARVVAENGAVLFTPATREKRILASPPPEVFASRLRARGAKELSSGEVVVALAPPHHLDAVAVARELGLDLRVTFNRGSAMVLPAGIDKRSGLVEALAELGLSLLDCVGVGDAENDLPLLEACGLGVAVANALPSLKAAADLVMPESEGAAVLALARRLVAKDLANVVRRPRAGRPAGG